MIRESGIARVLAGVALSAVCAAAIAGCGGGSATSSEPTVHYGKGKSARISTGTPTEGPEVLATEWGYSLYVFSKDAPGSGKSACYGRCEKTWRPLITSARPEVWEEKWFPQGPLEAIERTDGRLQVTYKGRPLYRYRYDSSPDSKGLGKEEFGGKWFMILPSGKLLG